jgi:uncharacterized membrane protein
MKDLLFACAVFLATHLVPSTPLRAPLVRALGQWPYTGLYSVIAFATIGWMVWEFNRAPAEVLWSPALRWLPAAVMPFAFILLAGGLFARNPTIVGGEGLMKSADPARGMIRVTRHPIMWGFMLWAAAHVLARAELKATVFFGTFLVLAAAGTWLMDYRKKLALGEDWQRFAAATSNVPFVAILQGRNRLDLREIGWRNPAIGLALYALVFWGHPWMFGVRAY